jgi:hypothetical protein
MNLLGAFESVVQGVVEGTFGRVFRSRLHPVELSKKLQRAMDQNLTISMGRRLAPNVYEVFLSERDNKEFSGFSRTLIQQLQQDLIDTARTRGYTLTSRPLILFHVDEHLVTGQVRVTTRLAEPQAVAAAVAEGGGAVEETREMGPEDAQRLAREVAAAQAEQQAMPAAWLALRRPDGGGQVYRLDRPVIHIGRHVSNEIVVNDRRVSRYHAEIRYERGQFVLYDLGSLNGVVVNGVVTHQPVTLRDGDQISVGNHDFIFQRR